MSGNHQVSRYDSKASSLLQYEHSDARDDGDVAETEAYQDDSLAHGKLDPDDAPSNFLQVQATKTLTKARARLPWPNLDADGGQKYVSGNQQDSRDDSKTSSLSQYEHTDARDDVDVA